METSFNASISGIKTSFTRQDITANDVANINTPGYEQSTPVQSELKTGGTEISSIIKTPNPSKEMSNTDLAEETVEQIRNKNTLSANVKVMKVQDEMLKNTIDLIA